MMPDNTRIVTGSNDDTARIWDARTGAEIVQLKGHSDSVTSVAVTPDSARVITGSYDTTARIWDARSGQEIAQLKGHTGRVNAVAVTPDGNRIVTTAHDATARIWDALTGTGIAELKGHTGLITSLAATPDNTRVITASLDGTTRLWDAKTGAEIARLEGHTDAIYSLALTPDGTRVITGSQDKTVRIWDARTGAPLGTLTGHTGAITGIEVTPDGTRVITISDDKTARIWDVKSGAEIIPANGRRLGHYPRGEDLKLSTAAGISARFPWLMPAATLRGWRHSTARNGRARQDKKEGTVLRLVDGGYFENSGSDTAGDLMRALNVEQYNTDSKIGQIKVFLIVLSGYDNVASGGNVSDETSLGELLSPLRALLSTRQARGELTVVRTFGLLCPDMDSCNSKHRDGDWHNEARWVFATLNLKDYELPLSWYLSKSSNKYISLHAGNPRDCGNTFHGTYPQWAELAASTKESPRLLGALNTTNCAASIICGHLSHKKLKFSNRSNAMENYCDGWDDIPLAPPMLPAAAPASASSPAPN